MAIVQRLKQEIRIYTFERKRPEVSIFRTQKLNC